jgi:nitrogen fixation NifU-like protein
MQLYKEELLDHYRFPRYKGKLVQPDVMSAQFNPSCGDSVTFEAKIANGTIVQIGFDGTGCVISQAAASMLAEFVRGKSTLEISALPSSIMIELIGMELGPTRLKCALLSLYALQEGLHTFCNKV